MAENKQVQRKKTVRVVNYKDVLEKKVPKKKTSKFSGSLMYFGIIGSILFSVFLLVMYFVYIHGLPSIKSLEQNSLAENNIVYDKYGKEIYRLHGEEKRTYVDYSKISKNMINAIVSTEDKTFFENRGFDFKGLVRAGFSYVTGRSSQLTGASTISQQLIKNTLLTPERSVKRKIQEVYLSFQLNRSYTKEKILELYLNKISYGNNAYGIEEASKTYFGKSASDLGVLGSSILASIPKGPTYYSPYTHRDRLMGYFYVYNKETPKEQEKIEKDEQKAKYSYFIDKFKSIIAAMKFKKINASNVEVCGLNSKFFKDELKITGSDSCKVMDYSKIFDLLNFVVIKYSDLYPTTEDDELKDLVFEYNAGRKDFVLGRMLEDEKITSDEYKNSVIGGIDFKFKKSVETIKYPYFIFYLKEYLESKYGKEFEAQGGLRIYTSLDSNLQDKAEELIKKAAETNAKKYGAADAAIVSVDNKTGQILAMVGGSNYFDTDNGSQVNMITAKRQPGSSFKPISYALAISKYPISPDTPIYDLKTKFGNWSPDNYDKKFMGKMTVAKALDYSRNIPAVKMFIVAGGEDEVVDFSNTLGIDSLKKGSNYGAPLSIGAGEVKPIEMAQAYSVFANNGYKKELTPIVKILDRKGNVLDSYFQTKGRSVFSDAASYVLSKILSDASSRPSAFWNTNLTLNGRPVAAKTGTSNKDVTKGKKKEILPGDLWTVGYTPQITSIVWAGNVDGSATKPTADGLNVAAPIWHDFMEFAHKGLKVENFEKPASVYEATISKNSGKLAGNSTPDYLKIRSIFAVKPGEYDDGSGKSIEVDTLCNGKVTENTPKEAIKTIYFGSRSPIIDSFNKDWLNAIGSYSAGGTIQGDDGAAVTATYSDEPCERPDKSIVRLDFSTNIGSSLNIGANSILVDYKTNTPIVKIEVYSDGTLLKSFPIGGDTVGKFVAKVDFGKISGNHTVKVRIVDKYFFSLERNYNVSFEEGVIGNTGDSNSIDDLIDTITGSGTSTTKPISISVTNPKNGSLSLYEGQFFNLKGEVSGTVKNINIYVDGIFVRSLGATNSIATAINDDKSLQVGKHTIKIEVIGESGEVTNSNVSLEIMKK